MNFNLIIRCVKRDKQTGGFPASVSEVQDGFRGGVGETKRAGALSLPDQSLEEDFRSGEGWRPWNGKPQDRLVLPGIRKKRGKGEEEARVQA